MTSLDERNQNNWKYSATPSSELHTTILRDRINNEINSRIRFLNVKQRKIFVFISHSMWKVNEGQL